MVDEGSAEQKPMAPGGHRVDSDPEKGAAFSGSLRSSERSTTNVGETLDSSGDRLCYVVFRE